MRNTAMTLSVIVLLAGSAHAVTVGFGTNLIEFDMADLFGDVLRDASTLGYTNSDEACFFSSAQAPNPACLSSPTGPLLFDDFVFFDEMHPTAVTHERLARGLFALSPIWP